MSSEKRRKLIAICSVCVCVCAVIVAGMLGQRHIDLSEYVVFKYSGANGFASVECSFDTEKMYNDLANNESNTDKLRAYQEFVDSLEAMTTQRDLANGDRVYVSVKYDKEIAQQAGLRVGNSDFEARAAGISEGTQIDLFEKVEVQFKGISPDAGVTIRNKWTEEFFSGLVFVADKTTDIVVGDEITVTCNISEAELARQGYVAKELSQKYVADKLSTYVESAEQVDGAVLKVIGAEIEAGIKRFTEDTTFRMLYKATGDAKYLRMTNNEVAENIELVNVKFLKRNADVTEGADNYIYYVYSADVRMADSEEAVKVYFAFEYSQGYITHEGNFKIIHDNIDQRYVCSTDYETIASSTFGQKKQGYSTFDVAIFTMEQG